MFEKRCYPKRQVVLFPSFEGVLHQQCLRNDKATKRPPLMLSRKLKDFFGGFLAKKIGKRYNPCFWLSIRVEALKQSG